MAEPNESHIANLRALLGADRVLTDAGALASRTLDTWPLRLVQKVVGAKAEPPLCVVRPRATAEVSKALEYLSQQDLPVIPCGGGSGVVGGASAMAGAVMLDLSAMDQVINLDETNLLVTAEAGMLLGRLEDWLNDHGYTTGHFPQSIDLAQLGGLVATRSAGQFSTRYGSIEDLLTGLEAVLPDGRVVEIRDVVRRSVGPDLRHLWLGSEGCFGVITRVTLKLFPKPASRFMQAYAVPSMRLGLELIRRVMREGWKPAVVRLHDMWDVMRLFPNTVDDDESILLILSEGSYGYAEAEGEAVDRIIQLGGARPLGPKLVEDWLAHRNNVSDFDKYIHMGMIVDTIEVAAGWTAIAGIYEETVQRLREEVPEVAFISGHSSHSYPQGTNLYFTIGAAPPQEPAAVEAVYWAIWSKVMETALKHGGTISHHHGIGRARAPWVPLDLGSSYVLLDMLKRGLDPRGLMNPGVLLPKPGQVPPR